MCGTTCPGADVNELHILW